ncbi:hypothetical protein [Paenibacillus terreus]
MILTQTVQFILILVFFHESTGQPWFENKIRDSIILTMSYVIFMVIPFFSWLFRPITITLKQESRLGRGIEVTPIFVENNSMRTHQMLRTVNLSIEIVRRGSVWWRLLNWYLRNKTVNIVVNSTPDELLLQPTDPFLINEVIVSNTGFKIDINPLIKSMGSGNGKFSINKSFPYIIADHPDIHIAYNLSAVIQPKLYIGDRPSIFLKLFIKYETTNHQVVFFRR